MRLDGNEARAVWALGKSNSTVADLEKASALVSDVKFNNELFVDIARKNKVVPIVAYNLSRMSFNSNNILKELVNSSPYAFDLDYFHNIAIMEIHKMLKLLSDACPSLKLMLIKGGALRALVPGYRRYMVDVDVSFPTTSDMWEAARILLTHGYVVSEEEGAWIQNFSETYYPHYEGHLTIRTPGGGLGLDLHHGQINVADVYLMDIDLWTNPRKWCVVDLPVYLPSEEHSIIITLSHMVNDGALLIRDLNDIYELLSRLELNRWSTVIALANSLKLLPYFGCVLQILKECYNFDYPRQQEFSTHSKWACQLLRRSVSSPGSFMSRIWLRAAILSHFTLATGTRSHAIKVFLKYCWSGLRIPTYGKWPTILQGIVDHLETGPFFERVVAGELQILLAPLTIESCAKWAGADVEVNTVCSALRARGYSVRFLHGINTLWISKGKDELVLNRAGMFLPTLFSVFEEEQLDRLQAIGDEIFYLLESFTASEAGQQQ